MTDSTRSKKRREESVKADIVPDEVKGNEENKGGLVGKERELYSLRTQIRHLYEQIKNYLPTHAEWIDPESGETKQRPARWKDIED